jgi:signal transduction histidine kinase
MHLTILEEDMRKCPYPRKEALETVDQIRTIIQRTTDRTRQIVRNLRPDFLEREGIAEALRDLVDQAALPAGTDVEFECSIPSIGPDRDLSLVLYRIVQEALTNAVKHAHASKIEVRIHGDAQAININVVDDGVGFELDAYPAGRCFGLLGMEERARSVGGTFEVETRPNEGTMVTARIPLRVDR